MKIAVDVNTMRYSDKKTIESGIDSKILMYNAGKAIFDSVDNWGKTAVVCGPGNNGGDGFVVALLLADSGNDVKIYLTQDKFSEDGNYYFLQCLSKNIPYEIITDKVDFKIYDSLVDCIFGTGFNGVPKGNESLAIKKINESCAFVVSADINSGMSGETGVVLSECVISDLTVSLGYFKTGHFLGDSKDFIKKIINCDIGIDLYGKSVTVADKKDFSDVLKIRKSNSHKGNFGYVGIVGGCTEYCGALKLANLAASSLRAGCGVVKLCVAKSIAGAVAPYLLESTLFTFDDVDGHMIFDEQRILEFIKGLSVISCGMGWGKGKDNFKILDFISKHFDGSLVIDADGLNTLSLCDKLDSFVSESSCEKLILTPHPLEFSRISGFSIDDILSNPVLYAQKFASRFEEKVILLLKGSGTVITDGKETTISNSGCPGMATAGSGDVLSGVITGLLGYNKPTVKTIACAAYLTGIAGEIAEKEIGSISMTSADTLRNLHKAVNFLKQK